MRIYLIIIVLALKHYMRITDNSLIKLSNIISTFISDLIRKITKPFKHMVYGWALINLVLCIILNLYFVNWEYIDYIWISVIITLMVTSIVDTFNIENI